MTVDLSRVGLRQIDELKEIATCISVSLIRYTDVVPADRAFYEAGSACKNSGKLRCVASSLFFPSLAEWQLAILGAPNPIIFPASAIPQHGLCAAESLP